MILYRKVFPLGKDISFFQYITAIRKSYFPNYVITIEKISSIDSYSAQVFFTAPLWRWAFANAFRDGVFLKKCTIQYFQGEDYFSIQGSPRTWNLLAASIYVISAFSFLLFILFRTITTGMLPRDIILSVVFIVVCLTPLVSIYFRDKRLLDKIGSLATEPNQKQG